MRQIVCLCLFLTCSVPAVSLGEQQGVALDEAVKRIKNHQRDVRVLSADRVNVNGELRYRIKVLTRDGRVRHIWRKP
ncbi:MAG: hypothetical protein MAG794_00620 [Gammaproteobacteria bacterium]|nr:hypothetical protein [Gammaproteobacteria bacterium]